MELRSQDLVVVLKILANGPRAWTYEKLAKELFMSASQVFRSVDRAEVARLLQPFDVQPPPGQRPILFPNTGSLKEFLIHGVKYAFPVHRGGLIRGMPTAHAAPPLNQQIAPSSDPPPVWPTAEGLERGTEFSPLAKNAPKAARRDEKLYELLALVDAIRDGRAREREIAIGELSKRIDEFAVAKS